MILVREFHPSLPCFWQLIAIGETLVVVFTGGVIASLLPTQGFGAACWLCPTGLECRRQAGCCWPACGRPSFRSDLWVLQPSRKFDQFKLDEVADETRTIDAHEPAVHRAEYYTDSQQHIVTQAR